MILSAAGVDFWRWQPHPEVWVLVGGVVALALYAVKVGGPKVVPTGRAVVLTYSFSSTMEQALVGRADPVAVGFQPLDEAARAELFQRLHARGGTGVGKGGRLHAVSATPGSGWTACRRDAAG